MWQRLLSLVGVAGLLALALTVSSASGQTGKKAARATEKETPEEQIKEDARADAVARIGWAAELAEEARKERSPVGLISAAVLLRRVPPIEEVKERPTTDEDKAVEKAEAGVETKSLREQSNELLDEAKVVAAKLKADGQFTAEQLAAVLSVAQSVADEAVTRGAVGGPKMFQNSLYAGHTDRWQVKFLSGRPAAVMIQGCNKQPLTAEVWQKDRKLCSFQGKFIRISWPVPFGDTGFRNYSIRVRNAGNRPTAYQMFTN